MTELSEPVKCVVDQFKSFAADKGDGFMIKDAVEAGFWTSRLPVTLGKTFNDIKELAGLPIRRRRPKDGVSQGKIYVSRYQSGLPDRGKGPLVKLCLGYAAPGKDCKRKVPKGEYFCPRCEAHKNAVGGGYGT